VIGRLGTTGRNRKAGCRGMATFAGRRARSIMGRGYGLGFRCHPGKNDAHVLETMTGRTTADDTRVVHHGGRGRDHESTHIGTGRRMAEFARQAGRNVSR